MSDFKPLLIAIAFIFFFGVTVNYMVSPFVDIEKEANGTWIEDIGAVQVTGFTIDMAKYIISAPVWIFDYIGNLFGTGSDIEKGVIVMNGTGKHDNKTLDGEYLQVDNETFERKIERRYLFFWDLAKIEINVTDNTVTDAYLYINFAGFDSDTPVYEAIGDPWYEQWNKTSEASSLNYSQNATAELSQFSLTDEPTTATQGLINFFDKIKQTLQDSVRIFGLMPQAIGIPLFIIIVLAIVLSIIKLLPMT